MITVTGAFFLSIFLLDIFYLSHKALNVSQTEAENTILIYKGQERQANFISRLNNLNLIYVRLKNPQGRNVDDFYLQIKDQSGNILRSINISGRNIGEDDLIKFQFSPINNVQNQKLSLSLNSATIDQNKAVLVYTDRYDQLTYIVYSTENWFDVLKRGTSSLSQRFTLDSLFAIVYLITWISIIIGYLGLYKIRQ